MSDVHYIKPFSKGQITIPKDIREKMGLKEDSWLKLELEGDTLLLKHAESASETIDREEYRKKLLSLKGDWIDPEEIKQNREDIEKQIESRSL